MDVKLNSESMYNLGNLALSIHGRGGGLGGPEVEEEEEMVRSFFKKRLLRLGQVIFIC
jgi:hypothetical protein